MCLAKRAPETFKLSDDADLNDAAQFSTDPTFRLIGSPTRWDRSAALTSTLHLFETELLSHWMSYIVTVQLGRIHHTLLHGRARPHTGQSFREPLGHRERGVIGRGQMSRSVGTSQSQYLAKTEVYVASL